MKKLFCLAFVLVAAAGIFAQEKTIEKSEFETVFRNSFRKFAGQSHRQTTTNQEIAESIDQNKTSSQSVIEFAAPRSSRLVFEFNSSSLNKRTESIIIGDKTYTRIDDGDWKEGKREMLPSPERKLKTVDEQIEYRSLGTELLNNQNTTVYAKIQKRKLINESNQSEMFSTITTKYWYGEDGGILKQEAQTENRIKSNKSAAEIIFHGLRVTVWELDPNIKIEEPLITK
jgi:hypothetical protein